MINAPRPRPDARELPPFAVPVPGGEAARVSTVRAAAATRVAVRAAAATSCSRLQGGRASEWFERMHHRHKTQNPQASRWPPQLELRQLARRFVWSRCMLRRQPRGRPDAAFWVDDPGPSLAGNFSCDACTQSSLCCRSHTRWKMWWFDAGAAATVSGAVARVNGSRGCNISLAKTPFGSRPPAGAVPRMNPRRGASTCRTPQLGVRNRALQRTFLGYRYPRDTSLRGLTPYWGLPPP